MTGAVNADACAGADVVVIAVPWDGHDELVGSLPLAGKTVVSCVNPLAFDNRGAHGLVIDDGLGSAAERAQALAPDATVVGAFHNVSAVGLWGDDEFLDEDVLCVGDSDEGKEVAMELARAVTGRDGISAGKLRLARQLEPLTAVLISINRKYKVHSGIRISGPGCAAPRHRGGRVAPRGAVTTDPRVRLWHNPNRYPTRRWRYAHPFKSRSADGGTARPDPGCLRRR